MTPDLLPPVPEVVQRGEIYWVDWSPSRGSEQNGHRPALIISPDIRNRTMPTVVIAAMTTSVKDNVRAGKSPVSLFLPAGQPMEKEGAVLGFQIMTIDKMRLENLAGRISAEQQKQVDSIIRTSFGLQ